MIDEIPARLKRPLFVDAPTPCAVIDAKYRIVEINKRFAELFEWTEAETEIKTFLDFAETQRDKKMLGDKIMVMIESGKEYDRMFLLIRTKLGELRKAHLQFMAITDSERAGKYEYAVVWATDLGPLADAERAPPRVLKLWPWIVIATVMLWFADFGELTQIIANTVVGAVE